MMSRWLMVLPLTMLLTACERGADSLTELERNERSTRLYSNAMDDLQAGRVEAAVKGFRRVVLDEPRSYSAHFQLATLLQDTDKDYIGAIAHYRAYLALRPAADKATVAQDRIKACETLLHAEVLKRTNNGQTLKEATAQLTKERDEACERAKKAEAELARSEQALETLKREKAKLAELLEKISAGDGKDARGVNTALKELQEVVAEDRRRKLNPTDAELLDEEESPRKSRMPDLKRARTMIDEEDRLDSARAQAKKSPNAKTNAVAEEVSNLNVMLGRKPKEPKRDRPETYLVQEGDTLYSISTRFYGTAAMWKKIREANRVEIPFDGRVRAGQKIRLP